MGKIKEVLHVLLFWAIFGALTMLMITVVVKLLVKPEDHVVTQSFKVHGTDMREQVECEFDPPLKYVTLQMHWYEDSAELNADYITYADPADHDEVWGWSNCSHDAENNSAWCDIYVVKPDFVHADMNVDTIGHEVLHASCGDFHE